MSTLFFSEDKDPTDEDYYEAEVDSTWLGAESIANVTWDLPPDSGLVLGNLGTLANVIRAQLLAGNPGTHQITITVTTSTGRIRQRSIFLVVKER